MKGLLPPTRTRVTGTLLIVACVLSALANLPTGPLPTGWLLAFLLPGAILGVLHRWQFAVWQRALLGVALQTTACWLALEWVGPMTRPAALACTILPPLAFATLRGQETDHALALFLSFCVLLIGIILDGVQPLLLAGYVAMASLSLRCTSLANAEAMGRRVRPSMHVPSSRSLVPASTLLVAGVLATVFTFDRVLTALPSPSRGPAAKPTDAGGSTGSRRSGLDDAFVLDGGSGLLGELNGEQLVRVQSNDSTPVPADLYLRSGFFSAPGLDRWQLGALDLVPPSRPDGHVLRAPLHGTPVHSLMIERFAGAQQFVFVPPGTCEIDGLEHLAVDPAREWLRQTSAPSPGVYDVAFQRLPPPPRDLPIDPRGPQLGLLQLPNTLDRDRFGALLQQWRLDADPLTAMSRLGQGLAALCRYDRLEPTGPHLHAIENFLFASGDRRGYCMHFASAAALLLRLQGISCRIGVGLYGGERDRRDPAARIFGSQHAHAWVEVPFVGRGYTVFDPTPPSERGQSTPTRRPTGDDERDPKPNAGTAARAMLDTAATFLLQPWLLAVLLLLAIGSSLLPRRRTVVTAGAAVIPKNARRALARLLQALAAAGQPRRRGQTLEAFAADLQRAEQLLPSIAAAFAAYQQVRFGSCPFDAERERLLNLARREVADRIAAR